jgi:hypothetical protein|tara:strand:+ start:367 stop:831 length:465 start_codon:yes stop_codon:yes gene_type:complete
MTSTYSLPSILFLLLFGLMGCSEKAQRFAAIAAFGGGAHHVNTFDTHLASGLCGAVKGGAIVSQDGTFLGRLTSEADRDSVFNEFGPYGSEFSDTSIWNEFGQYGGEFSEYSPFNEFAAHPPLLIIGGHPAAHLSVSEIGASAVHPYDLMRCRY